MNWLKIFTKPRCKCCGEQKLKDQLHPTTKRCLTCDPNTGLAKQMSIGGNKVMTGFNLADIQSCCIDTAQKEVDKEYGKRTE